MVINGAWSFMDVSVLVLKGPQTNLYFPRPCGSTWHSFLYPPMFMRVHMEPEIYDRTDMCDLVCVCRHPVYYKQNCLRSHYPCLCTILDCIRPRANNPVREKVKILSKWRWALELRKTSCCHDETDRLLFAPLLGPTGCLSVSGAFHLHLCQSLQHRPSLQRGRRPTRGPQVYVGQVRPPG